MKSKWTPHIIISTEINSTLPISIFLRAHRMLLLGAGDSTGIHKPAVCGAFHQPGTVVPAGSVYEGS